MAEAGHQPGSDAAPGEDEHAEDVRDEILQRSIFPWLIFEDERMGNAQIEHLDSTTVNEVAFSYGVPETIFADFLAKEIEEAESCYGLPFTLLMVASYAGMMICHHDCITVYSVENALVEQLEDRARYGYSNPIIGHKNLHSISNTTDFYSWMHQGLVPLLFTEVQAPWELSEGYNDTFYSTNDAMTAVFENETYWWNGSDTVRNISGELSYAPVEPDLFTTTTFPPGVYSSTYGLVSFYNRLIGGIRLTQERVSPAEMGGCESQSFGYSCARGIQYETDPDPFSGRRTSEPERTVWLWQHDNQTKTAEYLDTMERETKWIDEYTQKVEVGIATYNGEHNLLTLITINFFFSRAGSIHTRIIPQSVFAEQFPYDGTVYYVFDIAWLTCLVMIMVSESREVYQLYRRKGLTRSFASDYLGFWNCVDWLSVVYGAVIVILASVATRKASLICSKIGQLPEYQPYWFYVEDSSKYKEVASEGFDMLEYLCFFMDRVRILFATYPLVIILRLLKAFAAQPRLAVVTRTLAAAGQNLIHFMVVFISIFSAFVLSAVLLIGPYSDDFCTPSRAFVSTFRIAMGHVDWDNIRQVGGWEAAIFLGLFMVLVVFMMLNILLAIIMSAYYEIVVDLDTADTLLEEIGQAYKRWMGVRRGDMVPLMAVAHALKVHRDELRVLYDENQLKGKASDFRLLPFLNHAGQLRLVTVEFLKKSVMKMHTAQARELLECAVIYFHTSCKGDSQTEQMLALMTSMKSEMKDMKLALKAEADSSSESEDDTQRQTENSSVSVQRMVTYKHSMEATQIGLKHASLWIGEAGQRPDELKALHRDAFAPGLHDTVNEADDEKLLLALHDKIDENDDIQEDIEMLEEDKAEVIARTAEALDQIDFLEAELLKATEDTTEVGQKFYGMRHRVAALVEERHRANSDAQKGQRHVQSAIVSRAECFELVHSLSSENEGLEHQLARVQKDAVRAKEYRKDSTATLRKAQQRLEPKLERGRRAAKRAANVKSQFFSDMLRHTENAGDIEFATDVAGVADLVDAMRDLEEEAHEVHEEESSKQEYMGFKLGDHNEHDTDHANTDYDDDLDELVDASHAQMLVDYGTTQVGI